MLKSQLIADKQTKAHQINVETRNGIVQLNGFVDSAAAKTEAGRIAASANGVKSVKNNLEVRTDDRSAGTVMDDGGITAKVNAALAADPRTSSLRIDVEAHDGDVQLSGFAKNTEERMAAAEVAAGVAGVKSVKNSLGVR
jgi:hyperosmotically inducible protein